MIEKNPPQQEALIPVIGKSGGKLLYKLNR